MPRHPESYALCEYLFQTAKELVAPIEEILWSAWAPGDEEVDGLRILRVGFWVLGLQLAYADGNISESEAAFRDDVEELFRTDEDSSRFAEWSNTELCNSARETILDSPDLFSEVEFPTAVPYLQIFDESNGTEYADKAKSMYFRFANAMLKADGKVTAKEKQILSQLKDTLYAPTPDSTPRSHHVSQPEPSSAANRDETPPRSLEDLMEELNALVGLDAVKNDVVQLVNFLRVQQMRQASGMASITISRHLVFYGNPGTGKTTVARLLAQIYRSMGVISKGHLVETDRAGLVAGYVGQTALKVTEVVTSALGGVLFIDEAYTLAGEGQDFGQEAIDTLIKLMEDNRENFIVVVAGYTEPMNKLMNSNPGLRSRFNKYLSFDDYTPAQLTTIFELFCTKSEFRMTPRTREKVLGVFQIFHEVRDETFGNARLARNLFEQTVNRQANRIISIPSITEQILSTIEAVDIPGEGSDRPVSTMPATDVGAQTVERAKPSVNPTDKIRFNCPSCLKSLNVSLKHAGKRAKCPNCGNPVSIPQVAHGEDFG